MVVSVSADICVTVFAEPELTLRENSSTAGQFDIDSGATAAVPVDECGGTIAFRVWPGALSFAQFLLTISDTLRGQRIIELGCGVGLPGLTVAIYAAPASMLLTDRSCVRPVVEKGISENGIENIARFAEFDWGDPDDLAKYNQKTFDVVIGSELVYAEEQEPLINALGAVCGASSLLILSYRERSEGDSTYFSERILSRFRLVNRIGDVYLLKRIID